MLQSQFSKDKIEAGVDEAGRGCLAGPVFAAAVILNKSSRIDGIDDSKKLSTRKRDQLFGEIKSKALAYSIAMVSPKIIDDINILNASIFAMHKALDNIDSIFELILVDGNKFHQYQSIPHQTIIKGDGKYEHIAAASILAKCARDEYMLNLDKSFPLYEWRRNKGYPTIKHRVAISQFGTCMHHRKSFKLLA
jgi:ribonuclease HII